MITRAPSLSLRIFIACTLFALPFLSFAAPTITSLSPTSGPTSTRVIVTGTSFSPNNYVLFNGRVASTATSTSGGTTLVFTVPSTTAPACNLFGTTNTFCPQNLLVVTPATYPVQVENTLGTSNSVFFVVTASGSTTTPPQSGPSIDITAPVAQSTIIEGNTVNINFTASELTTSHANIELYQNGAPVIQIGTVNIVAGQTNYSVPWTVPALSTGTYTLYVADGTTGITGIHDSVTFAISTDDLSGPTLINIDPSQVVFNASTGTYTYSDPAQEAAFEQQVAALSASSNSNNQTDAAVGIIGDALVNSAGQCVGTYLAKAIATKLSTLGSAALNTPTVVPVADVAYTAKEIAVAPGLPSLDSIGYCIGNAMLETLSDSVTKWINNDFQLPDGSTGSAYLKDPTQFFQNLADVTAGQFLGGFTVNGVNLCSNFSLPLKLNLLQQYSRSYNQQALCTLGTIVHNLSAFTGGDFSQGGWAGWLSMTQNPNNNYYGSYIVAAHQLQINLNQANSNVQTDLQNGNGFLSFRKCLQPTYTTVTQPSGDSALTGEGGTSKQVQTGCAKWETETPGSIIAQAAIKSTQAGEERAIVANSFDQVVTALVTSMVTRLTNYASGATGGLGGL